MLAMKVEEFTYLNVNGAIVAPLRLFAIDLVLSSFKLLNAFMGTFNGVMMSATAPTRYLCIKRTSCRFERIGPFECYKT